MYNKNTNIFVVFNHFGINGRFLSGLSFVVMALQLLYAHARTEEAAILYLQTYQLLTRDAPNCPTCNRGVFIFLENTRKRSKTLENTRKHSKTLGKGHNSYRNK